MCSPATTRRERMNPCDVSCSYCAIPPLCLALGASCLDAQARGRALEHDLPAETVKPRRATAGLGRNIASRLDDAALLDQSSEILLVQQSSGNGLDGLLQVVKSEFGWKQFEHHGSVFQLAAQPSHGSGQDAAVVEGDGTAKLGQLGPL